MCTVSKVVDLDERGALPVTKVVDIDEGGALSVKYDILTYLWHSLTISDIMSTRTG